MPPFASDASCATVSPRDSDTPWHNASASTSPKEVRVVEMGLRATGRFSRACKQGGGGDDTAHRDNTAPQ